MNFLEIAFLIIIFLTNIIQAITGFAGTVLAMPPSLRLVGPDIAKPVLNLAAVVICVYVVITHFKEIDWIGFLKMVLTVGIGFGLGFAVERLPLNKEILLKIYGIIIVSIALFYMAFDVSKAKIPKPVLYLCLFFGGLLHMLYVSGGPLVVIFAMKTFKEKNKFRATLSLMWIVLNMIMFAEHVAFGLFTPHVWILFAIAFVISIVSYIIGHHLAKKLNLETLMKITYVLLFISGFSLIL